MTERIRSQDPKAWNISRRVGYDARCALTCDLNERQLYAYENNFKMISSTLGISRWKNMEQINDCGVRAAAKYPDMIYTGHSIGVKRVVRSE